MSTQLCKRSGVIVRHTLHTTWICVFTVLHIHACVPPPPTHLHKVASCLVTCSIFFPMAAKALQTLSLLPVTVTSLQRWAKDNESPYKTDIRYASQNTDHHGNTHPMDHCWTRHHGNRHTIWVTDHHGNRHYGSQITMETDTHHMGHHRSPWKQTHIIWIIMEHL